MNPQANPFELLSLIVAPAMLTNASSLFALSTSNRFARAADRARELSRQLEEMRDFSSAQEIRRLGELAATEKRMQLLVAALRSVYVALGSFASATLVSLLGVVMVPIGVEVPIRVMEVIGVIVGLLALSALVHASVLLIRETLLVVTVLQERAKNIMARSVAETDTAPGTSHKVSRTGSS